MNKKIYLILAVIIVAVTFFLLNGNNKQEDNDGNLLTGNVSVDGSSTVFPITEAVAEEFQKLHNKVRVTVGISGTGGGFKKFLAGETDINDASRVIKSKEFDKAVENSIEYIELPVAFDGLSVVISKENDFVDYLTVEELNMIWKPGSTIQYWNEVRPEWPNKKMNLYGPGMDSGTFDYFTEAINGKSQASRSDFTASEDDNILVQGISGDANALGFFGYAYYLENKDKLKIVPIDSGDGPVTPSAQTINDGSYKPLSRPIFIYVTKTAADRPEVDAFVHFYLENAPEYVSEVGYIAMPNDIYQILVDRFEKRKTGSVFYGKDVVGKDLRELYKD